MIYYHFVGSRESFPSLLAVLKKEPEKPFFILTESNTKAKIISRKLDFNFIKNTSNPCQNEIVVLSSLDNIPEKVNIIVAYSTLFQSLQSINKIAAELQNYTPQKVIFLLPEKFSNSISNFLFSFEYYFIDENNLPFDRSKDLTFVAAE